MNTELRFIRGIGSLAHEIFHGAGYRTFADLKRFDAEGRRIGESIAVISRKKKSIENALHPSGRRQRHDLSISFFDVN